MSISWRRTFCWLVLLVPLGSFAPTGDLSSADTKPRAATARVKRPAARPFDAERLVRLFRSNREPLKSAALDEIERHHLENAEVPDALWTAIQKEVDSKRFSANLFRAIRIHGRLPGEQVLERQLSLLSVRDPRVVLAATGTLAAQQAEPALQPILDLRERTEFDKSYGFRHAVVNSAAQYRKPATVDFLIDTLAKYDGQLRYVAARHLTEWTGQNFGDRGDAWKAWWKKQSRDEALAAPPAAAAIKASHALSWSYEVPTFYGAPIYGKRILFVIDRSKSMLSSVDRVTSLEVAQEQLEAAIRGLPEDTWFDILSYNLVLTPWRGELVPATPIAKSEALRFVMSLTAEQKTACYEALSAGLQIDPNLEAMYFLSDGEPTAGQILDPVLIVDEITRQNLFQQTAIHTIGIDAIGPWEEFLKQLAALNHGLYWPAR